MIKIGVIIPTFNRPDLAHKAILSALNQTYKPHEVIVIDDGSSEENFKILRELTKDLSVKIIKTSGTRSVGQARKKGMQELTSDFVAFLDDDDYWLSTKLEIQVDYIIESGARAVSCLHTDSKNIYDGPEVDIFTLKDLIKDNRILMSGAVVHLQILRNIGFFATSFSVRAIEDWATWLRVSTLTDWHRQNKPLVYYENLSPDSLRKFDDFFDQQYRPFFAYLDFLAWSKHQKVNIRYFSLLLRIFRFNLMAFAAIRKILRCSPK
jgi:glycosyltransferase involved in cell wall biosynthesis